MFEVYKPSGKFGSFALPLGIIGCVLAIPLAYIYQILLEWIPLIYISFLLTFAFSFALGFIAIISVQMGHVRNVVIGILLGLLICFTGISAKYHFQHQRLRQIFVENQPEIDPNTISFIKHLEIRAKIGWEIGRNGGLPITGIFVYLIWLIEAGIIFVLGVLMPMHAASAPYNEKFNQWADEEETVMTLPITDAEMISKIQAATSVSELLEIPIPKSDESNQFAVYKVNSIQGQELEDAYLTVVLQTLVMKKGEVETKEDELIENVVLSSENRKQLIENAELLQEAMADYRASIEQEEGSQEKTDQA